MKCRITFVNYQNSLKYLFDDKYMKYSSIHLLSDHLSLTF